MAELKIGSQEALGKNHAVSGPGNGPLVDTGSDQSLFTNGGIPTSDSEACRVAMDLLRRKAKPTLGTDPAERSKPRED